MAKRKAEAEEASVDGPEQARKKKTRACVNVDNKTTLVEFLLDPFENGGQRVGDEKKRRYGAEFGTEFGLSDVHFAMLVDAPTSALQCIVLHSVVPTLI